MNEPEVGDENWERAWIRIGNPWYGAVPILVTGALASVAIFFGTTAGCPASGPSPLLCGWGVIAGAGYAVGFGLGLFSAVLGSIWATGISRFKQGVDGIRLRGPLVARSYAWSQFQAVREVKRSQRAEFAIRTAHGRTVRLSVPDQVARLLLSRPELSGIEWNSA